MALAEDRTASGAFPGRRVEVGGCPRVQREFPQGDGATGKAREQSGAPGAWGVEGLGVSLRNRDKRWLWLPGDSTPSLSMALLFIFKNFI